MFNVNNLLALLKVRPFVPFRLVLSDGGTVEVKSPEMVLPGKQLAVVGILDPNMRDILDDRWTVVWYMHVPRVEMLSAGAPPFTPPAGPSESSTPSTI